MLQTRQRSQPLYAGSGGVFYFVDNSFGGLNVPLPDVFELGAPQSWDQGIPFGINSGAFVQAGLHLGGTPDSIFYSAVNISTVTNAGDCCNYIVDGSSYLLDATPESEYWAYNDDYVQRANEMSVYLVRTVVPLPPAVWLFGSGLIALWRLRTRS